MFHRNLLLSILCASVAAAQTQSPVPQDKLRLEDGCPIKLRLQRTISSADAHVDERIDFDVLEEVKVANVVVVPKGSIALGTVTAVQPKRRMGRGGKLDINIDSVRLADGEKTALRAVRSAAGGGHTGAMTGAIVATSLIAWPAAPLFLLMHGKDITIPKGTEITAYVNGDKELDVAKFDPANVATSTLTVASATANVPTNATPTVSLISTGVSNGAFSTAPQAERSVPEVRISAADPSTVVLKSDPDGAEIMVDGRFVGNTPSTVQLTPGEHSVSIQKAGFKTWQRELAITSGGIVSLNANLEKPMPPK